MNIPKASISSEKNINIIEDDNLHNFITLKDNDFDRNIYLIGEQHGISNFTEKIVNSHLNKLNNSENTLFITEAGNNNEIDLNKHIFNENKNDNSTILSYIKAIINNKTGKKDLIFADNIRTLYLNNFLDNIIEKIGNLNYLQQNNIIQTIIINPISLELFNNNNIDNINSTNQYIKDIAISLLKIATALNYDINGLYSRIKEQVLNNANTNNIFNSDNIFNYEYLYNINYILAFLHNISNVKQLDKYNLPVVTNDEQNNEQNDKKKLYTLSENIKKELGEMIHNSLVNDMANKLQILFNIIQDINIISNLDFDTIRFNVLTYQNIINVIKEKNNDIDAAIKELLNEIFTLTFLRFLDIKILIEIMNKKDLYTNIVIHTGSLHTNFLYQAINNIFNYNIVSIDNKIYIKNTTNFDINRLGFVLGYPADKIQPKYDNENKYFTYNGLYLLKMHKLRQFLYAGITYDNIYNTYDNIYNIDDKYNEYDKKNIEDLDKVIINYNNAKNNSDNKINLYFNNSVVPLFVNFFKNFYNIIKLTIDIKQKNNQRIDYLTISNDILKYIFSESDPINITEASNITESSNINNFKELNENREYYTNILNLLVKYLGYLDIIDFLKQFKIEIANNIHFDQYCDILDENNIPNKLSAISPNQYQLYTAGNNKIYYSVCLGFLCFIKQYSIILIIILIILIIYISINNTNIMKLNYIKNR